MRASHWPPITGHWSLVTLSLLLALGTGCRLVQRAVDVPGNTIRAVTPGKKGERPVDPVEVQQTLLRFADEFSTRMVIGIEKLRRGTNAPNLAEILQWKIALGTEASVRKMMESLGEIKATLVRITTGGAGRRPTVMLAPELTSEQRRAVKLFELERWFPALLSCIPARPVKP